MVWRDQLRKLNTSPIVFGGFIVGAAIGSILPVGTLLGALAGTILSVVAVLARNKGSDTTSGEEETPSPRG